MISLGGLVNQKAFGKFEMGKVISNPFANAFIKEGEDHEVSMGQNQLDTIIKMATELKAKMGEDEKEIPAWIQDHISKAENYISQAAGNYHEYGTTESVVTESSFKTSQLPTWLLLDDAIEFMEWYKDGMELKKGRIAPFNKADELSLFRLIKAWMQADDEYSKGVAHGGGVTGKRPNREQYKEKIEKFLLQKAKVANESVVNEEPAKSTGEKIQNLNNRIKALKDDMMSTNSTKQKNLIQQRLKNALQTLSNYKKQNISKESIGEAMSAKTPKIFVKTAAVEKKIKELMADRKKAVVPYNSETDPAKKEKLKQVLIKLTNQIKGYEKNLIQLRDMEEEYLQQLHSDAELDTTGL